MFKRIAIVLAAGKGTRMKSDLPKVLLPVCGRPMIEYVLDAVRSAGVEHLYVVVGYRAELVRQALANERDVTFVEQREQLGTGHAVMMCRPFLREFEGPVFVIAGDSPMLQAGSVSRLFAEYDRDQPACIIGTTFKDDPTGLGRVVRDSAGDFVAIVEEKDATAQQRAIREVSMSTYLFHAPDLVQALDQLRNENAQGEYYITDCPGILKAEGKTVRALAVLQPCEALGINTVEELAVVEQALRAAASR
jgi:bifunctional UDP-N-acetylglucosamine pyrophosphorylase/glucosamine-1-phosphate N-acetyltransferase/UDP-N-acetylglucosamine pyrophosphorylase